MDFSIKKLHFKFFKFVFSLPYPFNHWLPLFIKKDDSEGNDLYFMGNLNVDQQTLEETFIDDHKNNTRKQIVKIKMYLDKPIKDELYKYIKD